MDSDGLEVYGPLRTIRQTHRFAAFEGKRDGKPVFIKQAVDPKFRERLLTEATGLVAMKEIDPLETLYRVPAVVELTSEYIVTEWASGYPMGEDFSAGKGEAIDAHLPYLAQLYAFIDQRSSGNTGVTRFNQPGKQSNVNKALEALEKLDFRAHIDGPLIEQTVQYITRVLPKTETRFTNGDLQPGNLMIDGKGVPILVDCETCSWLWPRHYNIVNFICNYGSRYPTLARNFRDMFREYCEQSGVTTEESIDAFNVSAAARCLQIVQEQLTVYDDLNEKKSLDPSLKLYIEKMMGNIAAGEIFLK